MPVLGIADLKQFALPLGVDASEIARYQLADGTNYDQLLNDISAALALTGNSILNDPIYGSLIGETTEMMKEYRQGAGTTGMQVRTEYTRADPQRGATIGHMIPLKRFDYTLGWTADFLRYARRGQLDADIQDALYGVVDNAQRSILTRFFTTTENQMGSSGYDVPFVKGAGTVLFTPPPYNGQTFANTHTHFDRQTTSAQATTLKAGAKTLWEHGITGPYMAIIPFADITTYTALTGWIKPQRGIEYVRTDSAANFGVLPMDDQAFIGAFETDNGIAYCWASPRLPTNYLGMYKSYGTNNPNNPLALRYAPDFGAGPVLMRSPAFRMTPLEQVDFWHDIGIGMNNRLNGYACYFNAAGSYVDPTIS